MLFSVFLYSLSCSAAAGWSLARRVRDLTVMAVDSGVSGGQPSPWCPCAPSLNQPEFSLSRGLVAFAEPAIGDWYSAIGDW